MGRTGRESASQLITIRTGAGEDLGRIVLDHLFRAEKGGGADGRRTRGRQLFTPEWGKKRA